MGYRGHICTKHETEYGNSYFKNEFNKCLGLLIALDKDLVSFAEIDSYHPVIELNREVLLSIDLKKIENDELKELLKELLKEAIEIANTSKYSINGNYVRIE